MKYGLESQKQNRFQVNFGLLTLGNSTFITSKQQTANTKQLPKGPCLVRS
jgi:hypothetical protein